MCLLNNVRSFKYSHAFEVHLVIFLKTKMTDDESLEHYESLFLEHCNINLNQLLIQIIVINVLSALFWGKIEFKTSVWDEK